MKQFIAVIALVALVSADAPTNQYGPPDAYNNNNNNGYNNNNNYNPNNNVPIVRFENTNNGEAGYNYAYETGDGTSAQEQGFLKDADSPTAQGGFQFVAPDGQHFAISYTADENGFQAQGAHIPTPPPIPEEILKGLEQNRADEAKGIIDDGQYHAEAAPHQQYQNAQQGGQNGYY